MSRNIRFAIYCCVVPLLVIGMVVSIHADATIAAWLFGFAAAFETIAAIANRLQGTDRQRL